MSEHPPPLGLLGRLRIGVAAPAAPPGAEPGGDALDDFCDALSAALGTEVSAHSFAGYRALLDAMHAGDADLAWLPPVIALKATARGRTIPIALPVRGGVASFSTALFTRETSVLRDPQDLRGVRAAWVDRESAAGYVVIRASLRARGVNVDRVFTAESFLGSHEAVVRAVESGAADVGATFVHLDPETGKVRRAGWGYAKMRVIAVAGPIPSDVVAASIRMPVSTIRAVQRALMDPADRALAAAARALLDAEGFVEARSEHLDALTGLLSHLDEVRFASIPPPAVT
jgi:phosphonate transport system substrate-binding protein